jgi:hypothetical protein
VVSFESTLRKWCEKRRDSSIDTLPRQMFFVRVFDILMTRQLAAQVMRCHSVPVLSVSLSRKKATRYRTYWTGAEEQKT